MSMDRLSKDVNKKGPVCVGLDTQYSFLPEYLKRQDASAGEKIFEFNRKIIDAVYENAGCFKVQIACYEALGLDGMTAFAEYGTVCPRQRQHRHIRRQTRGYLLHRRAVRAGAFHRRF